MLVDTYRDVVAKSGNLALREHFFDMLDVFDTYPQPSPCHRAYSMVRFLTNFHSYITTTKTCGYRRFHALIVWKIGEFIIALQTQFCGEEAKEFCQCVWKAHQKPLRHIPQPFISRLMKLLRLYAGEPEWMRKARQALQHVLPCEDVVSHIMSFAYYLPASYTQVAVICKA
jgi:hypothetical protein